MSDLNLHSQILSKKKLSNLIYLIIATKDELAKKESLHSLISKYYQRLWFQKSMFLNKDELLEKYHILSKEIIMLEDDLAGYQNTQYNHLTAIELLHEDMNPYKGKMIQELELTQSQLFT